MTQPIVNRLNLIQGPLRIWVATWADAETEPADPATIATTPVAPFVYLGATTGGVTLTLEQTYAMLEVDQSLWAADVRLTGESLRVAGNMAEPTLANLKIHLNSGSITDGVFTPRSPDAILSARPNTHKIVVDGSAPGGAGLRRRCIIRRAVQTENLVMAGSRTESTKPGVSFQALYVDTAAPYELEDVEAS